MTTNKHPLWWDIFIAEYLKNGQNAAAAIRVAKPKLAQKSAKVCANRLLTNVNFKKLLEAKRAKVEEKIEMSRERWFQIASDVAGFDLRQYIQEDRNGDLRMVDGWKDLADGHAIEVLEINTEISSSLLGGRKTKEQKVKLRVASKLKALEMIGKALGYLTDKIDVNQTIEIIEVVNPYTKHEGKDSSEG